MADKNLEVAMRIKAQVEGKPAVDDLGKGIDDLGTGAGAAKPNLDGLGKELEELGMGASSIGPQLDKLDNGVKDLGAEAESARPQVDALGKELTGLGEGSVEPLRELEQEIERMQQALSSTGKAANKTTDDLIGVGRQADASGRALQQAFSVVGVRSAGEINAEIREIHLALTRLGLDARVSGQEFDRAWVAGQQRIADLEKELRGATAETQRMGAAADSLTGAFKGLIAAYGGMQLGREFIEANLAIESLERTMTQLTGSSEAAAKEIDWLKQTATRLGVQVNDSARAYASLAAATKGTRLEGEQTRAVFEAVAGAMSKLGRSSADTEGALQAISQMVGKGNVQMEELRGQLAERLPGALDATAKAMGITTSELVSMVGSGQVLASDLIPKLTEGLNNLYGTSKIEGTQAAWNRLKNSISETFQFIGQSGVMKGAITLMDWLGVAVRGLTGAFELLGKIAGISLGAIATFDFKHPIDSLRRWKEAVTEAGNEVQGRLDKANGALSETETLHERAAQAAEHAGAAAGKSAGGWLAAEAAYSKTSKAAEKATNIAVKAAEARQAEAKLSVDLANAFGTEAEKRAAGVAASNSEAQALQMVADARRTEAELARNQAQALIEAAGGEQNLNSEQLKSVQSARDSATAKQAEADKAIAAADAARLHAAAIQQSSAEIADNAKRVDELRAAMEQAQAVYATTLQQQKDGLATQEQVNQSRIAASQAAALYRDALRDQADARERDTAAARRSQQLSTAQLTSDQAIARAQLELARIRGDSRGMLEAQNKLRQIEIKMLEATAAGARLEAKATLASAEAKKAELAATGQLTPARQAEIDAMIQSAKLKELEAQKSDELARLQREIADALERIGTRGRDAGDSIADSYGRAADESDRLNKSIRNRPDDRKSGSGGGYVGSGPQSSGNEVTRNVNTQGIDYETLARQSGLRGDAVKRFAEIYGQIYADKMADFQARAAASSIGTPQGYRDAFAGATQLAINEAKEKAARVPGKVEPVKTYRLELDINGRKTPLDFADERSAQAMVDAFKRAQGSSV